MTTPAGPALMPRVDSPLPTESGRALSAVVVSLRATARGASIVPIVVGALVLVGWWQDVALLTRIAPSFTAMNPATAVGFILLGAAMTLTTWTSLSPPARGAAAGVGIVAALLGLSRLIALLFGWDLGLDQLLFRAKLEAIDGGVRNRMAPNTALNFVLLGAAVTCIDRQFGRVRWPAQWLAALAGITSLLALTGYAYGISAFYGVGSQIAMALPTAATFFTVAVGVLCARPTQGVMAVVSSDTSGGAMVRRLLPAVLVVPAVLGFIQIGGRGPMHFDPAVGSWLFVVVIMTVFAVLIGWNAKLLFRSDLERAASEQTLTHQATHDVLTQLPNRRMFLDHLEQQMTRANSAGVSTPILFLDLDLFKVVNDSLGHVVGDELLIAAGARIQQCAGEHDMVARFSGDEFIILLMEPATRERAIEVADCVKREFGRPFTLDEHEVYTTVSIGIAFSEPEDTPVTLIRHADIAMYRAKARGKARHEFFEPDMDLAVIRRLKLETELRRALANGELRVYYQPEVEIESGRLVGMEALVRWEHPERGLISPAEFMPVAEETGLVVPIGKWVLFEACRQAKEWQDTYRREIALVVSVNLSGQHLQQATLIEEVSTTLKETGIDPANVIIEITETVAMAGAETTIEILTKLKALGVRLAIDDFGTGFSSLAYLKRFPVDLLKIDKSFVDGVALNGHDTSIVQAVITLGHALGLTVIAEGVETPAQLNELRALGSELGQGYYFARPLSGDATDGMPRLFVDDPQWSGEGEGARKVG
jgi:diguanylate cyclase (GGDEF)-like protein